MAALVENESLAASRTINGPDAVTGGQAQIHMPSAPDGAPDELAIWELTGLPLPIVLRTPRPLTDNQIMAFTARNNLHRVEQTPEGDLYIMTPLGGNGGRWEAFVIRELSFWAEDNGGEAFSSQTEFRLPDGSARMPDTAWVSGERWQSLSDAEREKFPPLCPDFVIEVLSPSDSRRELDEKMNAWTRNGAKLAWMIDPLGTTVTIYRPGQQPEVLHRPDSVEAGEPVTGFRLTLAHRWRSERP